MVEQKVPIIYNIAIGTMNVKFVVSKESKFGDVRIVLKLIYLAFILYCRIFNSFRIIWLFVCVGFLLCGCVYLWVCL